MSVLKQLKKKSDSEKIKLTEQELMELYDRAYQQAANYSLDIVGLAALWVLRDKFNFDNGKMSLFQSEFIRFVNMMTINKLEPNDIAEQIKAEIGFDCYEEAKITRKSIKNDFRAYDAHVNGPGEYYKTIIKKRKRGA